MNNSNKLPQINIASPEFKSNPHPFYARLRAEAPVYQTILPDKQVAWLITRYEDVLMVLKDDQRFVKDRYRVMSPEQQAKIPWMPSIFKALERNLLGLDGADHARLRALVHKAFTPRIIERMQGRVEGLANELLDSAQRRGSMDLIRDYALPIPLTVISEILGVSPKDQANFHNWSKSLLSTSGTPFSMLLTMPNMFAIVRFLRRSFKDRLAHPRDDLMTALVQAQEAGDSLSPDELLAMVFILLIAGHETTVNLIGSGALALLENPDQLQLLRHRPELIKNATEELLRYVSPVDQATERYAYEDITLHGVTIPKGGLVLAVLASANRDETQFDHADKLDLTRENNKHLAFGLGVHYCVGAPLARLEGQIALNALAQRAAHLRLTTPPPQLRWRAGLTVRGLETLPVAL